MGRPCSLAQSQVRSPTLRRLRLIHARRSKASTARARTTPLRTKPIATAVLAFGVVLFSPSCATPPAGPEHRAMADVATSPPAAPSGPALAFDRDAVTPRAKRVLRSLLAEDPLAFAADVSPQLLTQMRSAEFARTAATLRELGAFASLRTQKVEETDGRWVSMHAVTFAKGEVVLVLAHAPDGRVAGLLWDGAPMAEARRAALARATASFAVQRFVYLVDEKTPNPLGHRFPLGQPVGFGFVVTGLAQQHDEHHVTIDLVIEDDTGRRVHEETGFFDHTFPVNAEGVAWASLYAVLQPPAAGRFVLRFTLRDVVAGRTLAHRAELEVIPAR